MIKITTNNENYLLITGHDSENEACARVTTVSDLLIQFLSLVTELKIKKASGITEIKFKNNEENRFIFNVFSSYLISLSNLYKNNITMEVTNNEYDF